MKKSIVKIDDIPRKFRGPIPDFKLDLLLNDFRKLKPRTSLKLEFDSLKELIKHKDGLNRRKKKYIIPEMRLIVKDQTLYVLKMPYNKEEEEQ